MPFRTGKTYVRRHRQSSALTAILPAHASIITSGHPLNEPRVCTARPLGGELHLNATVRECFERGCDRSAAPLSPHHAGAAILRRDRQTLIRHCSGRRRPRSVEALLN